MASCLVKPICHPVGLFEKTCTVNNTICERAAQSRHRDSRNTEVFKGAVYKKCHLLAFCWFE